ncbi:allantoinase [Orenia metallireducens]|uniref:allantoinase n=1 Tax=Orenia metallireducens TaxID=1413210 RepID=A0A285GGH1_9FIRM|nr:allantoinase AllB [Orenia metallireducens]PRX30458.1 allantoinase [Orenia metallireducens]SNY22669.1 allantoinase [Orenia metallireducens]
MFDLLIYGGTIVDPEKMIKGSLAVKNGKIAEIVNEEGDRLEAKEVIDATGKMIFPGAIDCHTHFNEPGFEWREDFLHGTKSAAAGGVTTIIDMPLQNDPATISAEIFERKVNIVQESAVVDYALWGGLVDNNVDDLEGMYDVGAVGLKSFLGPVSPDYSTINSGIVRDAMKVTAPLDILIGFHAEDYSIVKYEQDKAIKEARLNIVDYLAARPVSAEVLAVENIVRLAKETGAKVHICHVSHPEVAEIIKEAQSDGVKITAETCSHYLIFSEDDFLENGPMFKCAPPLRSRQAQEQLWEYTINGTISCVASDHSPCTIEEKEAGADNIWKAWGGISGVQSTFQVMFDEIVHQRKLSPQLLARILAYGPARAFNLYPQKGTLALGADADIVIVDPEASWNITPESLLYKNKISAFVGLTGKGLVERTIVRGETVFTDSQITVQSGFGRLIKVTSFTGELANGY